LRKSATFKSSCKAIRILFFYGSFSDSNSFDQCHQKSWNRCLTVKCLNEIEAASLLHNPVRNNLLDSPNTWNYCKICIFWFKFVTWWIQLVANQNVVVALFHKLISYSIYYYDVNSWLPFYTSAKGFWIGTVIWYKSILNFKKLRCYEPWSSSMKKYIKNFQLS